MHGLNVFLKMTIRPTLIITLSTGIWRQLQMNCVNMVLKITIVSKGHITRWTGIWRQLQMDCVNMVLKIAILSKFLITMRTGMWCQLQVNILNMFFHIALSRTGIFTVIALIFSKAIITTFLPDTFTVGAKIFRFDLAVAATTFDEFWHCISYVIHI